MTKGATNGASIASLPVPDVVQSLKHNRAMLGNLIGELQSSLTGHGTNVHVTAINLNEIKLTHLVEVNEMIGHQIPKIHHRHEGLTSSQESCVL